MRSSAYAAPHCLYCISRVFYAVGAPFSQSAEGLDVAHGLGRVDARIAVVDV